MEISVLIRTKQHESSDIMYKKIPRKWVLSYYSWGSGTSTHLAGWPIHDIHYHPWSCIRDTFTPTFRQKRIFFSVYFWNNVENVEKYHVKNKKNILAWKKKLSMIGIYFTSWCIFPTLQALSFSPPMKQLKLQAAREQSAFIQRCFTVNGTAIYKNHFFHSGHVLLCLYRDIFFNLEHKLN